MKKTIALLLVLVMVLSMAACREKDANQPETSETPAATESTAEETEDDALTHTFTQYGNARIKIVGAEAASNDSGEDLLRIYYDYTNTDDTANGHAPGYVLNFLSITFYISMILIYFYS